MAKAYTADQLTVLQGLEAVRKRPGMYIGGVNSAGLHHLVWEVLDNSVDEAMNGHASEITLTLHKSGETVTVADNGRGIPVDRNKKTGKSGLELVLTELHAGGKFQNDGDGNYKTSGGLHGVGASVVNALSKKLTEVGFDVERQEVAPGRFNLLARAGAPEVVFCTHLDTVPPFFGVTPATRFVPYSMACSEWNEPVLPVNPWHISLVSEPTQILIRRPPF